VTSRGLPEGVHLYRAGLTPIADRDPDQRPFAKLR
jgi:hypothetical protein